MPPRLHAAAPASPRLIAAAASALAAAAAATAGCGTRPPPGLLEAGVPSGTCQHTCAPDPGAPLVNCEAETAGLDFARLGDFNSEFARAIHSYTDRTAPIANFVAPDASGKITRKTYEPPTLPVDRCTTGAPGRNRVLHIQGGPFLGWGGGVGISMRNFTTATGPNCVLSSAPPYCTPQPEFPSGAMNPYREGQPVYDLSKYEGVSFWARRGPNSQAGFRVAVGDKYTDDDISFLMYRNDPTKPRYCERVKECACLDHKACTTFGAGSDPQGYCNGPGFYCGTPSPQVSGQYTTGSNVQCNTCQTTRCDEDYPPFPGANPLNADDPDGGRPNDPQFNGRSCTPYTFRNGVSSLYCYDPARDPPPVNSDQQCGDHWTKTVHLDDRWRFYKVPFSSMLQQGFGKRFPKLDLTAVSLVRITWDGGWADFYIDDLAFYRRAPAPSP